MPSRTPTVKVAISNIEASNIQIINEKPLELSFTVPENLETGDHDLKLTLTNLAKSYTKPKAIEVKPAIMNMQDMTPELCESLPLEEQQQFIDKRDGKVYWIAKLKDGNCWMTQNLDYDLSVAANQTLTPETSNVTESRTVTPVASWEWDEDSIYYLDGGDIYYTNGTTQTAGLASLPEDSIDRHYAQGDYYSWKAATAGQGTADIVDADVNESICPAGWRLPTSNSADANYSFGNLVKQYGYTGSDQSNTTDATLLASPLFFARGGNVVYGPLLGQGSYGRYWSSRASSNRLSAYLLYFGSSSVKPSSSLYRSFGFSVRCVAKKDIQTVTIKDNLTDETISTLDFEASINLPEAPAKEGYNFLGYAEDKTATTPTYNVGYLIDQPKTLYAIYEEAILIMQNVSDWKNKLELEQQIQVKDARDNKIYWVAKLKDGNIWMTQNLDYDLSVAANQTLTPETSNVTENRTVTPVAWGTDYNSVYYMDGGDNYFANGTTQTAGLASLPEDSIDRHYAQGDYYSWGAATAGQGTTNTDVNESICPAGWRLPTSHSVDANYSFGNLVKQYGYTGANQSSGVTDATLLASPFFFARGGYVGSGSLHNQGSYGFYCSSRASSLSDGAHPLFFSSDNVSPSYFFLRYFGYSVRCVAL